MLLASMEMERFWNLRRLKFVNHNSAKVVDVWNINNFTKELTKIKVTKLRTRDAQLLSRCHQMKWGRM